MKLIMCMLMMALVQEPEERLGMLGMGKGAERIEAYAQAGGVGAKRILKWKIDAEVEEFGREETGLVVYERQQDWLRVKLKQGASVWVKMPQGGRFAGLLEVLEGNLLYLTKEEWDERLSASAAGPRGAKIKTELEPSVKLVGKQVVAGKLWLEVAILDASLCEAAHPKLVARGWVPARMVWYFPHGC